MKVLLGFPQADRQTGVFIKNAFIENGCDVVAVHDPKVRHPQEFLALANHFKPDLIFMSRSTPYCSIIGALRKIGICAFWNVDVRYDINHWKPLFPLMRGCHFWFTIAKGNIPLFKKLKLGNPHWLSEGCDSIHRPPKGGNREKFDVFFAGTIGHVHNGRVEVIDAIKKNFSNVDIYNGLDLINEDHNMAVNNAKICLGHSGWPDVELSMSARDYRVMGAGGFLLTNHVKGIEKWFDLGEDCDTYSSPDEAVEKIKYYLEHQWERRAIAENAFEVAHEKHRFKHRIAKVLELARRW